MCSMHPYEAWRLIQQRERSQTSCLSQEWLGELRCTVCVLVFPDWRTDLELGNDCRLVQLPHGLQPAPAAHIPVQAGTQWCVGNWLLETSLQRQQEQDASV